MSASSASSNAEVEDRRLHQACVNVGDDVIRHAGRAHANGSASTVVSPVDEPNNHRRIKPKQRRSWARRGSRRRRERRAWYCAECGEPTAAEGACACWRAIAAQRPAPCRALNNMPMWHEKYRGASGRCRNGDAMPLFCRAHAARRLRKIRRAKCLSSARYNTSCGEQMMMIVTRYQGGELCLDVIHIRQCRQPSHRFAPITRNNVKPRQIEEAGIMSRMKWL